MTKLYTDAEIEFPDIPDSDNSSFEISTFLEENYSLFAVLSIFGAISVYIFDLRSGLENSQTFIVGFVSSQFLFLLTSVAIQRRIASEMGGAGELFNEIFFNLNRNNIELSVFLVSFNALVFSVLSISTTFVSTVLFLLQVVVSIVSFSAFIATLDLFEEHYTLRLDVPELDSERNYLFDTVKMGLFSTIMLLISKNTFAYAGGSALYNFKQQILATAINGAASVGIGFASLFMGSLSAFIAFGAVVHLIGHLFRRTISTLQQLKSFI